MIGELLHLREKRSSKHHTSSSRKHRARYFHLHLGRLSRWNHEAGWTVKKRAVTAGRKALHAARLERQSLREPIVSSMMDPAESGTHG
ncbi:hypothetical protein VIGAN_02142700 [Vigna angularis var. angularis]|uniref:Uncharacterized protein n=1 Tax=Vigna angularis var. angularis TaxID=157739 RepID=A0A0S3RDD3_PHAAN|nr:hypothetical protein VIGAN_02142700 [Vigna angularis var. angularis]